MVKTFQVHSKTNSAVNRYHISGKIYPIAFLVAKGFCLKVFFSSPPKAKSNRMSAAAQRHSIKKVIKITTCSELSSVQNHNAFKIKSSQNHNVLRIINVFKTIKRLRIIKKQRTKAA
jgi:hypothetical protein